MEDSSRDFASGKYTLSDIMTSFTQISIVHLLSMPLTPSDLPLHTNYTVLTICHLTIDTVQLILV